MIENWGCYTKHLYKIQIQKEKEHGKHELSEAKKKKINPIA